MGTQRRLPPAVRFTMPPAGTKASALHDLIRDGKRHRIEHVVAKLSAAGYNVTRNAFGQRRLDRYVHVEWDAETVQLNAREPRLS